MLTVGCLVECPCSLFPAMRHAQSRLSCCDVHLNLLTPLKHKVAMCDALMLYLLQRSTKYLTNAYRNYHMDGLDKMTDMLYGQSQMTAKAIVKNT